MSTTKSRSRKTKLPRRICQEDADSHAVDPNAPDLFNAGIIVSGKSLARMATGVFRAGEEFIVDSVPVYVFTRAALTRLLSEIALQDVIIDDDA